jgi:hypothetical protein
MTQQTTRDETVQTDRERPQTASDAQTDMQTEAPPPDPDEVRSRDAASAAHGDARKEPDDAVERSDEPAPRPQSPSPRPSNGSTNNQAALFSADQSADLRGKWETIQASFVDEPQSAVEEADALVEDVMQLLSEGFDRERRSLEGQWSRGDDVSTEELRLALRRYRSFFDRLLSI